MGNKARGLKRNDERGGKWREKFMCRGFILKE